GGEGRRLRGALSVPALRDLLPRSIDHRLNGGLRLARGLQMLIGPPHVLLGLPGRTPGPLQGADGIAVLRRHPVEVQAPGLRPGPRGDLQSLPRFLLDLLADAVAPPDDAKSFTRLLLQLDQAHLEERVTARAEGVGVREIGGTSLRPRHAVVALQTAMEGA